MTDRENLIDLLCDELEDCPRVGNLADHLIANGVTVQQWIPVTERLPENDTTVLVYRPSMVKNYMTSYYYNHFCEGEFDIHGNEVITHWMPFPEPLEEGET